jgi:succinate dehydrogenase/fumarate reductase flavoprotein subunit
VKEVLRYFLRHPDVADSLEGVVRWRVRQEVIHYTVDEVEQAVGWLARRGFLVRHDAPGIPTMFRLNHAKATAAERVIAPRQAHTTRKAKRAAAKDAGKTERPLH